MDCEAASSPTTIFVDCIMILISIVCMIIVIYGIYRYVVQFRRATDNYLQPPRSIHRAGLCFFIISLFTLFNTLLYDIFYLTCKALGEYEVAIYHTVYFMQIFCLWLVLFLRVYHLFKNSMFGLSRITVYAYSLSLVCVAVAIIPIFITFKLKAEAYITLPFVALSVCFSASLLITFLAKLLQIFMATGADELLIRTATKNTLLAIISICCTFMVILVLSVLYIKNRGFAQTRSVMEELILEFAILIDIVSNFVCVLLTYKFFDKQYYRICGRLDAKFTNCFKKHLKRQIVRSRRVISGSFVDEDEKDIAEIVNSVHAEKIETLTVNAASAEDKRWTITMMIHPSEYTKEVPLVLETADNSNSDLQPAPLSLRDQYHSVPNPKNKGKRMPSLAMRQMHSNPVRKDKRESLIQSDLIKP